MLQRIICALFSGLRVPKGARFEPKSIRCCHSGAAGSRPSAKSLRYCVSGSRSARACPQTLPGTLRNRSFLARVHYTYKSNERPTKYVQQIDTVLYEVRPHKLREGREAR